MSNKKNTDKKVPVEDSTKYEEFIPSFNSWLSAEQQAERAKELEQKIEKH